MKPEGSGRRGWRRNVGLSLVLFFLVLAFSAIPGIRDSQVRLTDSYFRLAPAPRQRSPVVVVLIDDQSLQKYGRWPWSRTLLARLTSNLSRAGAQVIGLDILLSEPQSQAADAALAAALKASGRAVIADKIGSYPDGPHWVEPLPAFAQSAAVGHGQAALDADGVCRRFPPRELALDGSRWAFAVEVARQVAPRRAAAFLASYGVPSTDEGSVLVAKPILVPIAFRDDGFETISAAAVLQDGGATVRGRPVLVGFGTAELGDRISTPLTGVSPSPGVMVHAQILDSILSGRMLRPLPLWLTLLNLLLTCGLVVWLFRRRLGSAAVAWLLLLAAGAYGAGLLVFAWGLRVLPAGQLLLAVLLGPVAVYSVDFVLVERSLTQQLGDLRRWLATRAKSAPSRHADDLSWKLDLLRRLQAELGSLYELHQTLLETTQDLVVIFDERGRLLLHNQAFAAGLGEAMRPDLKLGDLRALLVAKDDASLLPKGSGLEGEAYLGGELYLARIVPLPGTTLSPGGGTVVELASLRTRLERDRARAEALGFITHELRTPLVSIQGFADLMMQYPGSPSCAQAPETIFRESKRLLALINSYLDVLRLDAGARPIRCETVKLEEAVRQVFDILQPQAAAVGVRLIFESGESYEVMGDATLIGGAVLNLVSNAVKYGERGTEVRVQCRRQGDEMVLTVHNQGEPVPAEELPRLFDTYYRASAAPADTPGWGLGLAFVKRIAEKHRGSVRVESHGGGTAFEIRLPAQTKVALAKGTV